MYTYGLQQAGTPHAAGTSPIGRRLAAQVTAHISYPIVVDNTIRERKKSLMNVCGKYEGPQQLDIAAGDPVFMERQVTDQDIVIDDNVFSVFDGLPKRIGIWAWHAHYRFVGFAQDPFPFSQGTLAPQGLDVQTGGVVRWVNEWRRTVYPGERLTWVPRIQELLNKIDGTAREPATKTRRQTSGHNVVRAILVPIADIKTNFFEELATEDPNLMQSLFGAIAKQATVAELTKQGAEKFAQPLFTQEMKSLLAAITLAWPQLLKCMNIFQDHVVGMNVTATPEGSYGELQLLP
jgi:hypothetical protein